MALEHALKLAEQEQNPILLDFHAMPLALAIHHEVIDDWQVKCWRESHPRLFERVDIVLEEDVKTMPKVPKAMALITLINMQQAPGGLSGEIAYLIARGNTHKA